MHFDKRIIEDYDCSYYDDSINMVEREESSNFDSKYSDNTSSALLREELINKKIEGAIQRNFVINIKVEEPERIVERENNVNLFVSESGSKEEDEKFYIVQKVQKRRRIKLMTGIIIQERFKFIFLILLYFTQMKLFITI